MDFLELAQKRFSVRSFTNKPITKEHCEKIIKAASLAPAAHNNQPQKIIVCTSARAMELVKKCTPCHYNAPSAFVVCYDKNLCWKREFDGKPSGDIDCSIVATHMMLEAENLGVGMTWVMYFIPEAVQVEFELSDNIEPVALLVCGYPSDTAKPYPAHTQNRAVSEVVSYK